MKSSEAATKSKSHESRSLPTADEQAAAFAKLSQKDRDSFERQITNATTKVFYISPRSVNPTTGLVTVTHSFITTVTYVLLPIG